MSDKDSPLPGPERRNADAPGPSPKRPFATIDAKATEIAAREPAKPEQIGSGTQSSAKPNTGPPRPRSDQSAAAAKVAAAGAELRQNAQAPKSGSASSGASAPPKPSATTTAGSGVGRHVSHLGAGLLGGLLALAGSYLLSPSARAPEPSSADLAREKDVDARLAKLEQSARAPASSDLTKRLAAIESNAARVDDISRRLGALSEEQSRLDKATKSLAGQSAGADTAARVGKLEEQLSAISSAASANPQAAERIPALARLAGKLSDLETSTANRFESLRKDLTQDVGARATASTEASEAAKAATQRLDREVTGVRSEATRLGQRVDTLKAGADRFEANLRTLQADTGTLKIALDGFRTDTQKQLEATAKPKDVSSAVAPLSAQLAGLEQTVQGVAQAEKQRQVNAQRIVLSVELGNLKRAMDRGGAYASELATVRKLAGDRVDLSALASYQHDGVASTAELAREFRSIAGAILDADAERPNASVVDRLLTGARSIVRVRKVTHAPGDDSAEAVVGRMEVAIRDGRVDDVLSEAGKLSGKAVAPARDWLDKVKARQSVDRAIAALDADLKSSLGGTAPAPQKPKQQ